MSDFSNLPKGIPTEGLIVAAPLDALGNQPTTAQLIADPQFGLCVQFDGSENCFLGLPDIDTGFSGGFTLAVWFKPAELRPGANLIEIGNLRSDLGLACVSGDLGELVLAGSTARGEFCFGERQRMVEQVDKWYHLTFKFNCTDKSIQASLWVHPSDGRSQQWGEEKTFDFNSDHFQRGHQSVRIGQKIKGCMAHLYVYDRPLESQLLSALEKATWGAATNSFRVSHPLAVRMFDEHGHGALHLKDMFAANGAAHRLTVEIENVNPQNITLDTVADPADATHTKRATVASGKAWHFQWLFRRSVIDPSVLAGELGDTTKGLAVTSPDWTDGTKTLAWNLSASAGADGFVRVYALCSSPTRPALGPNQTVSLGQAIAALRGIGARGTQVQVLPNPDTVKLGAIGISGAITHHLQIIDAAGPAASAPGVGAGDYFEAGFIGGNRILNDGSSNTLILRIQPTVEQLDNFKGLTAENWKGFSIRLKLPVSPDGKGLGDLCTSGECKINITNMEREGNTSTWSHTFTDVPTWPLDLTLAGIVSTALNGQAEIRIAIKNIPIGASNKGDDEVCATVEKSPLRFDTCNASLAGKLAVSGDASLAGHLILNNGKAVMFAGLCMVKEKMQLDTNWGIYRAPSGTGNALDGQAAVAGPGTFNGPALRLRVCNISTQGILFENSSNQLLFSMQGDTGDASLAGHLILNNGKAVMFAGLYQDTWDRNWGIYRASSGTGNALDGQAAVAGPGTFNGAALRLRVSNDSTQGILFENSSNQLLFSVQGDNGDAFFAGNLALRGTIARKGQPLSLAGELADGQEIPAPAGTTADDWNILVCPITLGVDESANKSNGDNALLYTQCYATVKEDKSGWTVVTHFMFRYSNDESGVRWLPTRCSYLLVAK